MAQAAPQYWLKMRGAPVVGMVPPLPQAVNAVVHWSVKLSLLLCNANFLSCTLFILV